MSFLPQTKLGIYSVKFVVAFLLLFVLMHLLVASGQRGGATFFSNMTLTVTGILAATSGVAAFVTGMIGMVRNKESSILIFVSTALGFLILYFCLGEILSPH